MKFNNMIFRNDQNQDYRCYYCDKKIHIDELIEIDLTIKELDSEDIESIYDELGDVCKPKVPPYIHLADVDYFVLNLCKSCWNQAIMKSYDKN